MKEQGSNSLLRVSAARAANAPLIPGWGTRSQVFDADEAIKLFVSFYETGDIPGGYVLQPIEGYRTDGSIVDLGADSPQ